MVSELSLEISDSCNLKVMRLYDTSHYCVDTVENYLIEILPVNKSSWVEFRVAKNFSLTLNSSNLRYKKVNDEAGLVALPDGIYEIKQSVKPNIFTINHFYHLRTAELKSKIRCQWENLIGDKCKITREEFYLNRNKLREIEEYALAAKHEVEECLDKKKGKELYDFTVKLLEEYTNDCQC